MLLIHLWLLHLLGLRSPRLFHSLNVTFKFVFRNQLIAIAIHLIENLSSLLHHFIFSWSYTFKCCLGLR